MEQSNQADSTPRRNVHDFDDLPEPARARAVVFFDQLVADGKDESEAENQARALAEKWMRERAPG